MSAENVAIVRAIYDAFATGDVPGVLGRMDPAIAWYEAENFPYADGNPYRGPEAVANGVFARCIGEWDGFTVTMPELMDAGDRVIASGRYSGIYKATGTPIDVQALHVWTLAGGKAVHFQQHIDTLAVARATGAAA